MDHKCISDRAYFIWQKTGREDAVANWKQAEQECKKEAKCQILELVILPLSIVIRS